MKNLIKILLSLYNQKTFENEDRVVKKFISSINVSNSDMKYLEVGSGLCRFALIAKNEFANLEVKGVEISQKLVDYGRGLGVNVIKGNVVKMEFNDQEFDIVHCSHVIEHLDYKSITAALDEFFRILKINGYLIIRSPLHYPGFFIDIDHIRPYPPEAIVNYFIIQQQQKVGNYNVTEVLRWYRREAVTFYNSGNPIIKLLNLLFKFLWWGLSFPRSNPNGYVLILRKLS